MPNFHVLLVHFPIAFLTLYTILEIVKIKKLETTTGWQAAKTLLLILGTLSAGAAFLSGAAISGPFVKSGLEKEVGLHSFFATITSFYFFILTIARIIFVWKKSGNNKLSNLISNSLLTPFLALVGLGLILITAALGGIVAFGPDIDPFTKILNQIFFSS